MNTVAHSGNQSSLLRIDTPVEEYKVEGHTVHVKREDKCTVPPGPPFSKMRGVVSYMVKLKQQGVEVVGYVENSVSMASWGMSWVAQAVEMKSVIFSPQYKEERMPLGYHQEVLQQFEPELIPYRPQIQKVSWQMQKKVFYTKYPERSMLLPLGLPFKETTIETALEAQRTKGTWGTVVISIGSGTICSGLVKGFESSDTHIIAVRCAPKASTEEQTKDRILTKAGVYDFGGYFPLTVIPTTTPYGIPDYYPCPFICNPYYDRRAWRWLCENINGLKKPVLFWNIGAGWGSEIIKFN